MKRMLYIKIIAFALVAVMVSQGCQPGKKRSPDPIIDLETDGLESGLVSFKQIYHLYPSPAEMLSIIDKNEMTYDENLLQPVNQAGTYLDTKSKSLMLGVYMTDLAYTALFGRHELTLDYLEVVRSLSEEINIEEAVDDAMIDKAKNNVEFLDSLYSISNDAFMNILSFCENNERSNTVVMLSAGAFAESLYLAVNLIDDYETADQMIQHLADQKYNINNFMAFAESVKGDDPNVASTIEELKRIKSIYDGIEPGTGKVSVTSTAGSGENQPKKLVIGGSGADSQASLTKEQFEDLRDAIIELRTQIIEG